MALDADAATPLERGKSFLLIQADAASRRGLIQALGLKESTMKGSCLCGGVQYECASLDTHIAHCHCKTCRKAHAAAYASTAGVKRENFQWLKGQDLLRSFESSPGKFRYFCSACGTHLVAERPQQGHVIVRVASLDEDPGVTPASHIWCSHDVQWLKDGAAVPFYSEWQPGR